MGEPSKAIEPGELGEPSDPSGIMCTKNILGQVSIDTPSQHLINTQLTYHQ